jgi:hypothetical protein
MKIKMSKRLFFGRTRKNVKGDLTNTRSSICISYFAVDVHWRCASIVCSPLRGHAACVNDGQVCLLDCIVVELCREYTSCLRCLREQQCSGRILVDLAEVQQKFMVIKVICPEMSVSWSTLPFGYICIQHLVDERHEEASQFSRYFDILMT